MTRQPYRGADEPLAALAERQHGVVGLGQLREMGFGDSGIERRLRRGTLLAIHRGVYAVGHRKLTVEGRWMAGILAGGPGAVLSHRAAGQLWRIARGTDLVELTRATGSRSRAGLRFHRGSLPADEVEEVEGISVTSVSRTLLDLATLVAQREGFTNEQLDRALNEAEVRRLTSRVSIPDLLGRYPGRRGAASLRALLDDEAGADGITREELERRFAGLLDANDLPRPRRNADVAVAGRFLEVDCLWPAQRLIVELDGRAVHGTRRAFERDRERDRLLVGDGWRVVRITWRQLRDDGPAIADQLRAMLVAPTLSA